MRKSVTLGIVGISCLIALHVADRAAFAQAGSTGGTLGKTDKSASGGEEQQQTKPRRSRIVGPKTFQNPTINGIRVDVCLGKLIEGITGTGCYAPAADAWCRSKGLSRAISFTNEMTSPTYRQGEHSICRVATCAAFTEIVCE
jgi:hypothetical protein